MPTELAHLKQAKRSQALLLEGEEKLDLTKRYPEWSITVRFYVCLHVLEAILAQKNIHIRSHTKRGETLYMHSDLFGKKIPLHYDDMLNLSRKARYMTEEGHEVNEKDIVDCEKSYNAILDHARSKHSLGV